MKKAWPRLLLSVTILASAVGTECRADLTYAAKVKTLKGYVSVLHAGKRLPGKEHLNLDDGDQLTLSPGARVILIYRKTSREESFTGPCIAEIHFAGGKLLSGKSMSVTDRRGNTVSLSGPGNIESAGSYQAGRLNLASGGGVPPASKAEENTFLRSTPDSEPPKPSVHPVSPPGSGAQGRSVPLTDGRPVQERVRAAERDLAAAPKDPHRLAAMFRLYTESGQSAKALGIRIRASALGIDMNVPEWRTGR